METKVKLTAFLVLLMVTLENGFGQSMHMVPSQDTLTLGSYPIDVTPVLLSHYRKAADYLATHPGAIEQMKLMKVEAWNFSIGTSHSWWVSNLSTDSYYQDASTCRAVGKHCYIFVEDSLWNVRVAQAAVDSIENDFDNRTPADANRGIFVMDSLAFGTPPDVDNDPRIIILICNIQDGFNGSGGYVAGFFDPTNEVPGSNSNQAEIYYVDANPTDLSTSSGIQLAMSTTAHEFQHMINWNYHRTLSQLTFINESCSKLAELYCGYPLSNADLYPNETNHYLFDWRTNNSLVLNDYSRAQRFSLFLWDRFGIGIFKYIVQSPQIAGEDIINDALTKDGLSINFNTLFSDWLIANELNDTTSYRLYGYAYPNLPAAEGEDFYDPNTSASENVANLGAEYLIFKSGSNLNVTFTNTGGNSNLSVTAIEIGSAAKNVEHVAFGTTFSEPGFGSTYTTIAFVIVNEDKSSSASFSYQAGGIAPATITEVKWDTSEPTGQFKLTTSDTICVTFNAFPKGTLDSVRVALRSAGSIDGGVYQSTGVQDPTPLGKLLTPITATISTSSRVPYPVPYTNWATVNLTSKNIATDSPFAVAFVIGSNPTVPGVMVTDYPSLSAYHSFSYLRTADGVPSDGWYFISTSDSTVGIYLIRVYVGLSADTASSHFADVQVTDFVSSVGPGTVTLTWKSVSEKNNAGFNLLRQIQGNTSFAAIASYKTDDSLVGLGTSSIGKVYQFTDKQASFDSTYLYLLQCESTDGTPEDLTTLSVTDNVPNTCDLLQNYPNPVNPTTKIVYQVTGTNHVTLRVYDVLGREIKTLVDEVKSPERYEIKFDAGNLPSGVYFYRITAGSFSKTRKLVVVK